MADILIWVGFLTRRRPKLCGNGYKVFLPVETAGQVMKRSQPWMQGLTEVSLDIKQRWEHVSASKLLATVQGRVSQSAVFLTLTVVSLSSALGQRFYNTPKLDVGKAAPQTINAPATVAIADPYATAAKRNAAQDQSLSVWMVNQEANRQIDQTLGQSLVRGTQIRQVAGDFPFTATARLSLSVQSYLRKTSEAEWQKVLEIVEATPLKPSSRRASGAKSTAIQGLSGLTAEQKRAIAELATYRRSRGASAYFDLIPTITEARYRYTAALESLLPATAEEALLDVTFLDLPDPIWQQTQTRIRRIAQRILGQGITPGHPQEILTPAVQLQVKGEVPLAAEPVATRILLNALQPNLVRDEEQTRLLAEKAAREIPPVMIRIRQGEIIVRQGETITPAQFTLLDHFQLSRRGVDGWGMVGFGIIVSAVVVVVQKIETRLRLKLRRRDRLLLWLLCLSTPLLMLLRIPSTNLPAVGMLVGSFYGSPLGMAVTGLLSLLLAIGMPLNWIHLFPSTVGGMLCGYLAGKLRSREDLALLGAVVGVIQGSLYLLLNLAAGLTWYQLLSTAATHALLGLAWCIGAIGSSPYLEQLFDLVTTLRLVELANPNCPLLKQLASEAPGTFQHTLMVATLAEAAAKALGCNVELVRTGTLYHDIGKMHDPQSFIENQMGGPNKHDEINDPWISAEIIKKHVSEGLVMARRFRLPKVVQSFIPEHQGTMLIAYFYHQAQQRSQASAEGDCSLPLVQEADFRYAGPAPQSRETGIVMLADSCEAALRSLKDATPEEALAMINKILRARWQDNQLEHSGLSRQDLDQIATIFVQVWQQVNHQRIAYPKTVFAPSKA